MKNKATGVIGRLFDVPVLLCVALSLTPIGAAPARADDAASLSNKIVSALQLNGAKDERGGTFDDVVRALIRDGYLRKRYDAKQDYSEVWKVLKPLDVFGSRVLVVSNEREGKYIGCCFQNRTELLMRATGDVTKLRDFAQNNKCQLAYDGRGEQDSLKLKAQELKIGIDEVKLVELSCTGDPS